MQKIKSKTRKILCFVLLFVLTVQVSAFAQTEDADFGYAEETVQNCSLPQENVNSANSDDSSAVQENNIAEQITNTESTLSVVDENESAKLVEQVIQTEEDGIIITQKEDNAESVKENADPISASAEYTESYESQESATVANEDEINNDKKDSCTDQIVNAGGYNNSSEEKQSGEEGQPSEGFSRTITVDAITVGKSPANDKYSCLSFTFSSDQDESVFECYITGFEIMPGYEYGESTAASYAALCKDIAQSYYNGENFKISDEQSFVDKYSLRIEPVDAEKDNLKEEEDYPDNGDSTGDIHDGALCWAAASSNLLEYTKWAEKVRELYPDIADKIKDEDALFTYYTDIFYNRGLTSAAGIRFFIDGINIKQNADINGNICYYDNTRSAQVKKEGNYGFLKQYCAEDIVTSKEIFGENPTGTLDEFSEDAELLKSGYGIGLGFNAHATTLFGYIKDKLLSGINSLRAIFIADSDNDAETTTKTAKENKTNSITMYTNISKGEGSYDEDEIIITNWSLVKPCSDSVPEDRSGKTDARTCVDYSAYEVYIPRNGEDKAASYSIGDSIEIDVKISNYSYKMLSSDREPHLKGRYIINVDGADVDTISVDLPLMIYECSPNAEVYSEHKANYTLKYEGDYEIRFVLDGIYYNDGSKVEEAYYSNNSSKINVLLSVLRTPTNTDATALCVPADNTNNSIKKTFYCGTNDFSYLCIDGARIDESLYKINSLGNNMYEVVISQYAIKTLARGIHHVEILTSQNETAVSFSFTIN